MKLNTFAFVFAVTCATSTITTACESVMGGCAQEATHDTSSHMKSQIVNKVDHTQTVDAVQAANLTKVKSNTKQANKSGNLVQALNKTVLK